MNYMDGARSDLKLMNTHLHLLEAMTTFYRASRLPLARERLLELIAIESNSVVRKNIGACTDQYERNWTPLLLPQTARASYGHDLENIWLVIDACQAAEVPNSLFRDLFHTLFDYSLRYGYDAKEGGFYESGPLGKPADRLNKTWWVEAEVLVSSLYMFGMTKDQQYARTFEETFKFVETRLVDWKFGEWFETITPDGKAIGNKGHIWKAGYHNGRAMMECLSILKSGGTIQ
jgi:mannobiose 2-epimerase